MYYLLLIRLSHWLDPKRCLSVLSCCDVGIWFQGALW